MERETATKFIHELLDLLVKQKGSDLFITAGFPPAVAAALPASNVAPQPGQRSFLPTSSSRTFNCFPQPVHVAII